MSNLLYAPPLNRGGLQCEKFLYFCINQTSKECVKHTKWALALTANIGDNKVAFEIDNFFDTLYKFCKADKNMFIENLATNLDLKNESKNKKED